MTQANLCLTCTRFRTNSEYLTEHKKQLRQTQKLIDKANSNGWVRVAEMNQKVLENLENIIRGLEDDRPKG